MKRKSMRAFLKENREEIDEAIKQVCQNCRFNDKERESWVINDEGLYNWARSEGVNI